MAKPGMRTPRSSFAAARSRLSSRAGKVPAGTSIVEAGSDILAPGFVDLQVNGGGGVMLNDHPTVEGIETICRAHARFGTTALLPTLITDTPEVTAAAVAAGIEAARRKVPGFAGLHLEGPHLSIAARARTTRS